MNCPLKHGILFSSHKIGLCSTNGIKNDMPRASSVNLLILEKADLKNTIPVYFWRTAPNTKKTLSSEKLRIKR